MQLTAYLLLGAPAHDHAGAANAALELFEPRLAQAAGGEVGPHHLEERPAGELQPQRELLELARAEDSEAAERHVHDGAPGLCVQPLEAPGVLGQELPDRLLQLLVGDQGAD